MNVLVDANLSPRWVAVLVEAGHQAVHWSEVGRLSASDAEVLEWARSKRSLVLTHDLDFGALLAMTRAQGPSVIQLRAQDVLPEHLAELVLDVLANQGPALNQGAIISLDARSARIRVLPLMR